MKHTIEMNANGNAIIEYDDEKDLITTNKQGLNLLIGSGWSSILTKVASTGGDVGKLEVLTRYIIAVSQECQDMMDAKAFENLKELLKDAEVYYKEMCKGGKA